MTVGQFIYLKTGTEYAEVYDMPTIQGTPLGFNAGYVGKITKLNVTGLGESQTYTELEDKYGTKQYFSNRDAALFDFTNVSPEGVANTGGNTGNTGGTSGGNGGTTLDKIGSIFSGLLGIFGKSKTPSITPPTTTDPATKDPAVKSPTPANNDNPTGIAAWVKKNVVLVIIGVIVLMGGIIWAIVASVKADKKDKEFQQKQWENKTNGQLRQFGMAE
ncbi:MAG: hypothetical protein H7339_08795 [Arcicella sp.]|nr:hypothetical protein [Arcicella sp.]